MNNTKEKTFIDLIRRDKIPTGALLVYSDWLLELGDYRGEIISLEVELTPDGGVRSKALRQRLQELYKKTGAQTRMIPTDVLRSIELKSKFGFIIEVTVLKNCLDELAAYIFSEFFRFLSTLTLKNLSLPIVPNWVGRLTNLRSLGLEGNALEDLPESIASMEQLTELDLKRNRLDAVPPVLERVSALEKLNLHQNQIKQLPQWIGGLNSIRKLNLSRNQLVELPAGLSALSSIERFDLAFNELSRLPESLGEMVSLHSLNLSHNSLTEIPGWIGNLRQLRSLSIADNAIESIPESIGQLLELTELDVGDNNIQRFPACIGRLPLTNLKFGYHSRRVRRADDSRFGCCRGKIPFHFSRFLHTHDYVYLRHDQVPASSDLGAAAMCLDASDATPYALSQTLNAIGKLNKIDSLYIRCSCPLPAELFDLSRLKYLAIENHHMSSISSAVVQLVNLRTLYLDTSRLTGICREIYQLKKLRELSLSVHYVGEISREIENLQQLVYFSLRVYHVYIGKDWEKSYYYKTRFNQPLSRLFVSLAQMGNLRKLILGESAVDDSLNRWQWNNTEHIAFGELPDEIGGMASLEELDISDSYCNYVSAEAATLTNLKKVWTRFNQDEKQNLHRLLPDCIID